MSSFNKIDNFKFWCHKILPLVYDDSLSYYELLCKLTNIVNKLIENNNNLPEYIKELLSDENIILLINEVMDSLRSNIAIANDHGSNTTTANRNIDELVWLNNDLFIITRYMNIGEQYVVGSNCKKISIEDIINELKNNINSNTTHLLNLRIGNVKDYGATGDGITDDTIAINKCMSENKQIYFPEGTYLISNTLNPLPASKIFGSTAEKCIIKRANTMTTDTMIIGSAEGPANNFIIENLWFLRQFTYSAGGIDYPLNTEVSHIKVRWGQNFTIRNCMLWGCPISIDIYSSSLGTIYNNTFVGSIWNPQNNLLESIAEIRIGNVDNVVTSPYCQLMNIYGNHFGGGYSTRTSVNIGSASEIIDYNIGSANGLMVFSCEGLNVHDNYFGGQNSSCISFDPHSITTEVRLTSNYFEPAFDGCIKFLTSTNESVFGCIISNNNFNGQLVGICAIFAPSIDNRLSVIDLIIDSNHAENFLGSPLILFGVKGCKITNNVFSAYNALNSNPNNFVYNSGIFITDLCEKFTIINNSFGGNINNLGGGSYCVNGVYVDSVGKEIFIESAYDIGLTKTGALVSGASSTVQKYSNEVQQTIPRSTDTTLLLSTHSNNEIYNTELNNNLISVKNSKAYNITFSLRLTGTSNVFVYYKIGGTTFIRNYNVNNDQYIIDNFNAFLSTNESVSVSIIATDASINCETFNVTIN